MKKIFQSRFFLLPMLIFIAVPIVQAADKNKEREEGLEKAFIEGNIAISEWFDGIAEGLDMFLVEEKLTSRKNETRVAIDNTSTSAEGNNFSNNTNLNVDLRLPNVEEYWNLKFTSYDEREENRGVRTSHIRPTTREKNYGASVGFFRKLGNIRTAFQPRVALQDPLKISHSLTFESIAEVKDYRVNPKLEFFATPDKGTGIFQAINFNYEFNPIWSLTLINEGEYQAKTHLFAETNGFSFGQVVTKKSVLAYGLFFNSNNQPSYHLQGYSLSVSWSHLIYRKILDYQVVPHWDFDKDRNWRGMAGLVFNVTLNF